jgi:hypothetical protein
MTRFNRWPPRSELVEPEIFQDFSETLTGELEDTVRNLKVLGDRAGGTVESRGYQMQAIALLTDELREQRRDLAKVIQTMNTKASRGMLDKMQVDLTLKIDKRLDTIRNWIGIAIAVASVAIALFKR